jgi:hypothetical protein
LIGNKPKSRTYLCSEEGEGEKKEVRISGRTGGPEYVLYKS